MATLLKGRCLFLHVPKTGGGWVVNALKAQRMVTGRVAHHEHACMDRSARWFARRPWMGAPRHTFCFVRNPLSWYESWFRFMSDPKFAWRDWGTSASSADRRWHPCYMLNGCGSEDLNEFVSNVVRKRPGFVTELFGWYAKPPVSFVGKQENLAADLIKALHVCGLAFDEEEIMSSERMNVSRGSVPLEWDPALRKEVIRLEYPAFRRYGYEPV